MNICESNIVIFPDIKDAFSDVLTKVNIAGIEWFKLLYPIKKINFDGYYCDIELLIPKYIIFRNSSYYSEHNHHTNLETADAWISKEPRNKLSLGYLPHQLTTQSYTTNNIYFIEREGFTHFIFVVT